MKIVVLESMPNQPFIAGLPWQTGEAFADNEAAHQQSKLVNRIKSRADDYGYSWFVAPRNNDFTSIACFSGVSTNDLLFTEIAQLKKNITKIPVLGAIVSKQVTSSPCIIVERVKQVSVDRNAKIVETDNNSELYWCCLVNQGIIMAGSDLLFDSLEELTKIVTKITESYLESSEEQLFFIGNAVGLIKNMEADSVANELNAKEFDASVFLAKVKVNMMLIIAGVLVIAISAFLVYNFLVDSKRKVAITPADKQEVLRQKARDAFASSYADKMANPHFSAYKQEAITKISQEKIFAGFWTAKQISCNRKMCSISWENRDVNQAQSYQAISDKATPMLDGKTSSTSVSFEYKSEEPKQQFPKKYFHLPASQQLENSLLLFSHKWRSDVNFIHKIEQAKTPAIKDANLLTPEERFKIGTFSFTMRNQNKLPYEFFGSFDEFMAENKHAFRLASMSVIIDSSVPADTKLNITLNGIFLAKE